MKAKKQVKGFEGLYEICSDGTVISVERVKKLPDGQLCKSKERVMSPAKTRGYCFVYLSRNGKMYRRYVHRLVAQAFIPNPENKPYVNHIDGDKQNNRADNLEWCTQSENVLHATRVLGLRSIKIAQYDKRGNYIKTWTNANQAAEELGISRGNINSCINKHRKTAGGYRWEALPELKIKKGELSNAM